MRLLQRDRYRGPLARAQPGGRVRLASHPLISGPHARVQAAAENGVSERVTTAQFDWSAEEGVPEGAPFELVLGADVLYDKDNARHIARLLPRLLADGGRCLISDQVNPNPDPNPNPNPNPKPNPNPNPNPTLYPIPYTLYPNPNLNPKP